jgi:hypothetical protein
MNKLLIRLSLIMGIGLTVIAISGCFRKTNDSQIVARINNYSVTIDDFQHEAGMSIYGASKELILQDIINKELLLQEAQKINLDKNKYFMKEIEDYWKQTLIKRLINLKGDEFLALSKVSAEEIKAEYNRMYQEETGKIKPYEQVSGKIQEQLRTKKAQIMLDNWINGLRKNADIKEFGEVLNGIKLKNEKSLVGGIDGK